MENNDVAALLRSYQSARNQVKDLRIELVKFAVEELGMDQKEVSKIEIDSFLDGYLVGQAIQQPWRNIGGNR